MEKLTAGLTDKEIHTISSYVQQFTEIEEVRVFGSRALGTYKEASDVDLAIFGTAVSRDSASKLKFEIEEESYLPYFFDVVSYNNISNADLKEHIDRHGMTIYRQGWRKCKLGSTGIVITGKTPSIDNPEDWGK